METYASKTAKEAS